MKLLAGLLVIGSFTSAFAMTLPADVVSRLESEILPAALSGQMRITKVSRESSSGRVIPNGTCTFTSAVASVTVEYCDKVNPEASRVDSVFNDIQETHRFYVERNSASMLPRFSLFSQDASGTCLTNYGSEICYDASWLDVAHDLRSLNSASEAPSDIVNAQQSLASRLENVARALRNYARVR